MKFPNGGRGREGGGGGGGGGGRAGREGGGALRRGVLGPGQAGVRGGRPEGEEPSGKFDLAATPQINEYNGRRSVQLKVLDWCQSGGEME